MDLKKLERESGLTFHPEAELETFASRTAAIFTQVLLERITSIKKFIKERAGGLGLAGKETSSEATASDWH